MDLKKNLVLSVTAGIALLLVAVLVFFMFQFKGRHSAIKGELSTADMQLKRLVNRPAFPSDKNVVQVKKNFETLDRFFQTMVEDFSSGQKKVEDIKPAQFSAFLENSTRELRDLTETQNVKIPQGFAFGFDIYERGALPEEREIERLQRQVFIISDLTHLLVDNGARELVSFERERFDQVEETVEAAPDPRANRRRTAREPEPEKPKNDYDHDLYYKEKMQVTFLAREDGVWNILDQLAQSELFAIVESIEIKNAAEDRPYAERLDPILMAIDEFKNPKQIKTFGNVPMMEPTAPPAPLQPPSRDERIIAGREMVQVRLNLSIIYLKTADAEDEEGAAS